MAENGNGKEGVGMGPAQENPEAEAYPTPPAIKLRVDGFRAGVFWRDDPERLLAVSEVDLEGTLDRFREKCEEVKAGPAWDGKAPALLGVRWRGAYGPGTINLVDRKTGDEVPFPIPVAGFRWALEAPNKPECWLKLNGSDVVIEATGELDERSDLRVDQEETLADVTEARELYRRWKALPEQVAGKSEELRELLDVAMRRLIERGE